MGPVSVGAVRAPQMIGTVMFQFVVLDTCELSVHIRGVDKRKLDLPSCIFGVYFLISLGICCTAFVK